MSERPNNAQDEAAIRTLVQDWAAAVRARDLPGVLRHHAADMVMFDVPPPLQLKGIDAYRESWDQFFTWSRDPIAFDIGEMKITAGSDVGFVVATMRCAGREADGTNLDLDFRLTIGLVKSGGQWTITHEHHSIPAEE
jgi:uncharacterized protein (TIGR02246 family)